MTEQNTQGVDLCFDASKSFKANCEAFLDAVKADDPEMAAILRANWDMLITIVREGERDSKTRSEFNSSIASALDIFVAKLTDPEGDV